MIINYEQIIFTWVVVRRPASKAQRSYNGGNVGTHCVRENDQVHALE